MGASVTRNSTRFSRRFHYRCQGYPCEPKHIGPDYVTYFRDPDGIILEIAQDDR